ncbi:MAG: CbiX/SirB N-terminal domain-containing protein [Cytophagales bacterium]|nr:CbiX/SirB N-terminal domain-containing protein [Armatimonadota bacterium]
MQEKKTKRALILFSHGSLLCGSGEALEAHAARLREQGEFDLVSVGYLNYTEPRFSEAAAQVIAGGASEIVVVPYFLVPGFFVTKSLPEAVDLARARFPGVRFIVSPPLGDDARLADALLDAALNARGPEHWRDPIGRAALACRPSPDCPLYGTPACPKVPEAPLV